MTHCLLSSPGGGVLPCPSITKSSRSTCKVKHHRSAAVRNQDAVTSKCRACAYRTTWPYKLKVPDGNSEPEGHLCHPHCWSLREKQATVFCPNSLWWYGGSTRGRGMIRGWGTPQLCWKELILLQTEHGKPHPWGHCQKQRGLTWWSSG